MRIGTQIYLVNTDILCLYLIYTAKSLQYKLLYTFIKKIFENAFIANHFSYSNSLF